MDHSPFIESPFAQAQITFQAFMVHNWSRYPRNPASGPNEIFVVELLLVRHNTPLWTLHLEADGLVLDLQLSFQLFGSGPPPRLKAKRCKKTKREFTVKRTWHVCFVVGHAFTENLYQQGS